MKDFLGKTLELDDNVVFTRQGYREFCKGKVIRFSKQMVRVEYIGMFGKPCSIVQYPNQLIKYKESNAIS